MTTIKDITEAREREIGAFLAKGLKLRRDSEHRDRWQTEWGTKTDLGLYRTIVAMIVQESERGEYVEVPPDPYRLMLALSQARTKRSDQ